MIPPIYATTTLNFFGNLEEKYTYFQSARASLVFLLGSLSIDMVLIPSYTCPTVVEALKSASIEYDFVDLGEDLDFNIEDLEFLIDFYSDKNIALLPTSLFNANIRDYKKIYPDILVIEDLTQSLPMYKKSSDFAIYSFGKSKLLSAFGGGVLEGYKKDERYNKLPQECTFFKDYTLSIVSQFLLKYGWNFLYMYYEKHRDKEYIFSKIEPKRVCDRKKRWICALLKNVDLSHREKISTKYLELIDKKSLFSFDKGRAYLRMPIKKRIVSKEISYMEAYRIVYKEARKKRGKELEIAHCLADGCSFLPTHTLVGYRDVERFSKLINNKLLT